MKLIPNQTYTRKEIAEWFGIEPRSFSKAKESKLLELEDYAIFNVQYTEKGSFKSVTIKEVFCDTYYKS